MKESFSITPRVFSHLGEGLIRNESIALIELVKNSYDANAKSCRVDFHVKDDTLISISIMDDGIGMNADTIRNVWLVIGTDFKKQQLSSPPCGRLPLGEKGIGRLGVHKLGRKISLVSKTLGDDEVRVLIDWNLLDAARTVSDFPVEVTESAKPTVFNDNQSGTTIQIDELKTCWDKRQVREAYRNLMSLNSPFPGGDDSFKVEVACNGANWLEGMPSFDAIKDCGLYFGHCVMKGTAISEFKYEFKPWSSMTKIDGRIVSFEDLQPEDRRIIREEDGGVVDLDQLRIGSIEFDLIIFETDAQIFNMVVAEKTSVKSYLRENGGVRVYRDNMRVYDYGERSNDWLGIDLRRVHKVGGNVSNNIILGSVRLERLKSLGLEEKTNREGFIENDSYTAFVEAVDYAMSLFVKERNVDKARLAPVYKTRAVSEPVVSEMEEIVKIIEHKIPDPEAKEEVLRRLARMREQYDLVKEVLAKSANAGLNLGIVIHEIEKLVASLLGAVSQRDLNRALIKKITDRLETIVRGYSAMLRKTAIGQSQLSTIVETAIDNYEFRFSDHKISVFGNWQKNKLEAVLSQAEAISVITNILDNAIYWLCHARRAGERKISIHLTDHFTNYAAIVVSDNGPGFNIPADVAIQPFITGKPHNAGMGLGLHIADEMMRMMKGKLLFLDPEDADLPNESINQGVDKAIIALCFPIQSRDK